MQPAFLDTNILVYAYDAHEAKKHGLAVKLLHEQLASRPFVISSQVINEFCNVMTSKKGTLMTVPDLHKVIQDILSPLLAHLPSVEFYKRAVDLKTNNSLSFYDALIIQAAIDLGCDTLYSEDLQPNQTFGSLKIVNPFK